MLLQQMNPVESPMFVGSKGFELEKRASVTFWQKLKHAIWQPGSSAFGNNASNLNRTFGAWNHKVFELVTTGLIDGTVKKSFWDIVFLDPAKRLFCVYPEARYWNGWACVNLLRWVDYCFEVWNGMCDWLAIQGRNTNEDEAKSDSWLKKNIIRGFAFLLRLPCAVLQNIWNMVAHPIDYFFMPFWDAIELYKNDKISGWHALGISFLQAIKVALVILTVLSAVGVVALPFITSGMNTIINAATQIPVIGPITTGVSTIAGGVASLVTSGTLNAVSAATVATVTTPLLVTALAMETTVILPHGSNSLADTAVAFALESINRPIQSGCVPPINNDGDEYYPSPVTTTPEPAQPKVDIRLFRRGDANGSTPLLGVSGSETPITGGDAIADHGSLPSDENGSEIPRSPQSMG